MVHNKYRDLSPLLIYTCLYTRQVWVVTTHLLNPNIVLKENIFVVSNQVQESVITWNHGSISSSHDECDEFLVIT